MRSSSSQADSAGSIPVTRSMLEYRCSRTVFENSRSLPDHVSVQARATLGHTYPHLGAHPSASEDAQLVPSCSPAVPSPVRFASLACPPIQTLTLGLARTISNMTAELRDFYVYVYVDPRNYEEFYYGKGKGARRIAHLSDETDSEKVARINAIRKEGLDPIVRTIAAGLTEQEALLIETTLIWKLGKNLTNLASGHFVSLFRPHNTLHKELPSFDFQNGIYLVNVGEGPTRNWDDCLRLGFLAAGGD